jgi:hypothetical protein
VEPIKSEPLRTRNRTWAERRANRLNKKRDASLPLFVGTPALEQLAPTVTTEDMVAWDQRHTEGFNRWREDLDRRHLADLLDHRAVVLAYGGAVLAELHEVYINRVYGVWPQKPEYHGSHYIQLCRANGWPNAFGDQEPSQETLGHLRKSIKGQTDFVLRFIAGDRPKGKAVFEELSDDEIQARIAKRAAERNARRVEVGPYTDSVGKIWAVYRVPPAPGATSVQYDFVCGTTVRTLDEWQIERDFGGSWRAACAHYDNLEHGRPFRKSSAASSGRRRRR